MLAGVRCRTAVFRTAALTTLVALLAALAAAVPQSAAAADTTAYEVPVSTDGEPLMLAATGLDLAVPVIIGLGLLVLGTAVVAVVTLRGGRQH